MDVICLPATRSAWVNPEARAGRGGRGRPRPVPRPVPHPNALDRDANVRFVVSLMFFEGLRCTGMDSVVVLFDHPPVTPEFTISAYLFINQRCLFRDEYTTFFWFFGEKS